MRESLLKTFNQNFCIYKLNKRKKNKNKELSTPAVSLAADIPNPLNDFGKQKKTKNILKKHVFKNNGYANLEHPLWSVTKNLFIKMLVGC